MGPECTRCRRKATEIVRYRRLGSVIVDTRCAEHPFKGAVLSRKQIGAEPVEPGPKHEQQMEMIVQHLAEIPADSPLPEGVAFLLVMFDDGEASMAYDTRMDIPTRAAVLRGLADALEQPDA